MFENAGQLREFLFTLLESLPHGILLADPEGLPIAANQKWSQLAGISGSASLQHSCWKIFTQSFGLQPADIDILKKSSSASIVCEVQNSPPNKAGEKYFRICRNDLKSPFLDVSGFIISLEDITLLKMAEAQIERRKRFAAMEEMAVTMSQELKNPLGGMELYASMLKRELAADPENETIVDRMLQALKSMDLLLNNYMTFARLPKPQPQRIIIKDWIHRTINHLQLLDKGKNIEISGNYSHSAPEINGDPDLLEQLSMNLGLNALDAMKDGQLLRIETKTVAPTEEHPALLSISFADQGQGIPQKIIAKIFDPFFTTKDNAGGLGLAVAHYITESHNGLIKVESRESKGTTIVVLLPMSHENLA